MSRTGAQVEVLRQELEKLAVQLPRSNSKDEALKIAIRAAETSMNVLGLVTDKAEKERTRAHVKQLMSQAERIKQSTDWRREIQATTAPSPSTIVKVSTLDVGRFKQLREPLDPRGLSAAEEKIVLRGGFLNGIKFPQWPGPPSADEFTLGGGGELFFDEASELPLSDSQLDVLDDWKRPRDALPPPTWYPDTNAHLGPVMDAVRNIDLVQDAATDCSVVASLCALLARHKRGFPRVLTDAFFPRDAQTKLPVMSENGKYMLRMNFNGCYRKVVIDDRIPTSLSTRVMHVVDRNNPGWLWPALVEKAYLKVRGGYDFPGSNSSTDLWVLTGWIPEQVFLQCDEFEPGRFWKRVFNGFTFGDVLVTLGTGKMSGRTEKALGLAGEHDYAVLDLREVDGQCLMLIKNPWCQGTSWQGRFQRADSESDGDVARVSEPVASPRDLLNVDDQLSPGTFWMDLDNVLQHFESIYLNWNTGLFKHRRDTHFQWDLTEPADHGVIKPRGPYVSLRTNPQFTLTAEKGGTAWALLWRHFQNFVPEDATPEEIESGRQHLDLAGHISLLAMRSGGRRVVMPPEGSGRQPWYVDSPQTLVKLDDCEPGVPYTLVPVEQELAPKIQAFTISAFSNSPLTLSPALPRYPHVARLTSAWTKASAGGNAQHPTYTDNPQFALVVSHPGTRLRILLEAAQTEVNVHVKLLHRPDCTGGGTAPGEGRVHRVRNRDIVVDSRDYRRGCCVASFPQHDSSSPSNNEENLSAGADNSGLDAGIYTLICSTFEPNQLCPFSLVVESSLPTRLSLLPREGAGRVRLEMPPVALRGGESRVAIPVFPKRLVNLYFVARHLDAKIVTAAVAAGGSGNHHHHPGGGGGKRLDARLSLEVGRGAARRVLAEAADGSAGAVRTGAIDLGLSEVRRHGVEECWLVLGRMYAGSPAEGGEERFRVEVFADRAEGVEWGEWRVIE